MSNETRPEGWENKEITWEISHRGYTIRYAWSDEDDCYVGHVTNCIRDIIGGHGDTHEECKQALKDGIDDYIEVKKNKKQV